MVEDRSSHALAPAASPYQAVRRAELHRLKRPGNFCEVPTGRLALKSHKNQKVGIERTKRFNSGRAYS